MNDQPLPADPALAGPVCSCGHRNAPGADRCTGPRCGRVLPGNRISLRHGLTAHDLSGELARQREAFEAASVSDDGGESEVPTRRRALHEYRARLHGHIGQLSNAIEAHGLFDRRGRLRAAWLQRLEGLIDRARGIDQVLGLGRQSKQIESAADIVASYRREAGGE